MSRAWYCDRDITKRNWHIIDAWLVVISDRVHQRQAARGEAARLALREILSLCCSIRICFGGPRLFIALLAQPLIDRWVGTLTWSVAMR
jgi:hypothetical protein